MLVAVLLLSCNVDPIARECKVRTPQTKLHSLHLASTSSTCLDEVILKAHCGTTKLEKLEAREAIRALTDCSNEKLESQMTWLQAAGFARRESISNTHVDRDHEALAQPPNPEAEPRGAALQCCTLGELPGTPTP